jgi:hypothetical protein
MAEEALEGALAGPAAVTVHDDGDVLREAREVEGVVDRALFGRELVRPVGALIGAAGGGVGHGDSLSLRIDDGRVRRTGIGGQKCESFDAKGEGKTRRNATAVV